MALGSQLLNELHEEGVLLFELHLDRLKVLLSSVTCQECELVVLDQGAELLDADQDLTYELADLGLFPSQHRLLKHFVKVAVVQLDQVLKDLDFG